MRLGPHPQRDGRTTAPGVVVTRGGDFLDQARLDQFGRHRRDRGGADAQVLGKLHAGDLPGSADQFEHLLAQRALTFGQRGNQGADALAPLADSGPL